ncbi:DUF4271 domain-containing protein [Arcticibacterium luteifluviistationis]|uniref:DUF4271 domain-containing protein n=1 Tax=Arcticibacterium luteifluviistationis TaxID=1784714 RepID=A0A2Z4GCS5_9BACT|nr:DUF4271 domain-containing protein [Arcticibacterium luteifluviistationis]AWV99036.1 hypothetical protein DJ013_13020 [Arcticibacterium luteifluviistationis]
MKLKILFFFLLIQTAYGAKTGPEDGYFLVYNLSQDLHVYNEQTKEYEPYIEGISPLNAAHTIFLETDKYQYATLLIKTDVPESYIFINGLLYKNLVQNEWLEIPVKELSTYGKEIALSFYGTTNPDYIEMLIASKADKAAVSSKIIRDNLFNMKLREQLPNFNVYILLLLLIFTFLTLLSVINPKAFNEYFNFQDLTTVKIRDTKLLISKPLNQINITFMVLLSMLGSFLYLLLRGKGVYMFQNQFPHTETLSTLSLLFLFLKISLLCVAGYLSKYFLLTIGGNLFGLEKSVNIHYFKIIQYNLFAFFIVGIGLYAYFITPSSLDIKLSFALPLIGFLVYGLRTTLVYFTILKSTGIQSVYLFAYLCVVEILPVFIGIRFAF